VYDDVNVALHDELDRAYLVDESVTAGAFIVARFTSTNVERYVSTTGGSLGWGPGAAAGVALATGEPVTCVLGDGALFFGLHGLVPAVAHQLPVTYVVLDNGGFASTQMYEQQYVDGRGPVGSEIHRLGSDFRSGRPSVTEVSRGLGIPARDVTGGDELRDELLKPTVGPRLFRVELDRAT
jgi:thiamine pyrophosphate-dependent acetolactate synthase large subunit-like protein